MRPNDPCACKSSQPSLSYAECCRPAHQGTRPPEDPGALVRARYSAFALGLGEFLHATLASAHPDRAEGDEIPSRIAELSRAGRTLKYMGVQVLASDPTANEALFLAKVFEKGRDRSFAELSSFVREEGALRYASGLLLPRTALPVDWASFTRESFRAYAAQHPELVEG